MVILTTFNLQFNYFLKTNEVIFLLPFQYQQHITIIRTVKSSVTAVYRSQGETKYEKSAAPLIGKFVHEFTSSAVSIVNRTERKQFIIRAAGQEKNQLRR